ncbi:MAG: class I SAM-dependent methyltransferase [Ardenticatenaceae bacterium]|nr:class I SAM-dependent methyltransferase [Ardenticatenaceae bacterium]
MRKRVRLVQKWLPQPGHVLDVGCATGTFLASLREHGWNAQGVELSHYAAEYARQRHGLTVFTGELAEAHLPDKQFDLVVLWDVLEHVHQPRETLLEAARVAKQSGTLLLVLPNPHSIDAWLFGKYWAGWDTPRHLYIYTEPVIRRLLYETGWQMVEMTCITGRIWFFNLSLSHLLQNKLTHEGLRRLIIMIMQSLPVRILSLPYFMIIERLKKGAGMAVFAHRLEEDHG